MGRLDVPQQAATGQELKSSVCDSPRSQTLSVAASKSDTELVLAGSPVELWLVWHRFTAGMPW
eukprot:746166-Amphidinium_carterae.1